MMSKKTEYDQVMLGVPFARSHIARALTGNI